jgi:hypothetical protein
MQLKLHYQVPYIRMDSRVTPFRTLQMDTDLRTSTARAPSPIARRLKPPCSYAADRGALTTEVLHTVTVVNGVVNSNAITVIHPSE